MECGSCTVNKSLSGWGKEERRKGLGVNFRVFRIEERRVLEVEQLGHGGSICQDMAKGGCCGVRWVFPWWIYDDSCKN